MTNILTILLASSFAGFLGAITGLGGGSIMVPFLVATGIPVKYAIANSMITIIATSSGSASAYVRERLTNIKAAMYLEIFTITGAIIGAYIALLAPSKYLYFFFAAFLSSSFYGIRREIGKEIQENVAQDGISQWLELEGSYFDEAIDREVRYKMTNALWGGLGMVIAGLAAGMLGIGAGAFKVAIHELILKMPSKVSSSTSNFIIGMTALAGSSVFIASGFINLTLAAPMAIGTTIGSLMGTRVLNKLSNKTVRLLFTIVLAYLIVQMIYKGVVSIA
ncbi:MAG: sulfite exporter TauE/SafE family protein [Thermoproteota archaeon]|nr:MAG: sulfite exporter TauE/SafE family protein [Candidatus Korarchaeota archaeon]RLG53586.1 MAG: sulfite exporter TauE/SafE family protein [Candidatus Korarchaeota archaeon]